MRLRRLVAAGLRVAVDALCRVDDAALARVPRAGPLILAGNHINFLEVPVLYTRLMPRPLSVLAKAETWDNPVVGWLFDTLGKGQAIPVRRGEADLEALRLSLAVLEKGQMLALAPEGTRSGTGCLQRGQPGVTLLALRSGAPILPVVYFGGEQVWQNLKRLRRTDFHVRVGTPFYLEAGGQRVTRDMRQQMTDELMWQLAALLPPAYRGVYADLTAATETYLRFPAGSASHVGQARAEAQAA